MKSLIESIAILYLLLHTSNVLGSSGGIIARINGQTLQLINLNAHAEWNDYCIRNYNYYSIWRSYSVYHSSLRRMFNVTCRSLGYEALSTYTERDYGNNVIKSYSTYAIDCQGNEASLDDCDISYSNVIICRKFYDLRCQQCTTGSVRLTGGLVPQQGHVEICALGIWTRACTTNWNYQNSFVTCRQLNYPTSELQSFQSTGQYSFGNQGFNVSNQYYQCYGNESRLANCRSSISYSCGNNRARNYFRSIVLYCDGIAEQRCNSGGIRLHRGEDEYEGRLQVCVSGLWTAVKGSSWNYFNAQVACRQLYLFQLASTKITWKYVRYATPIRSTLRFRCTGSEHRLQECSNYTTYRFNDEIYLRCQLDLSRERCNHGQVRLVGGPVPSEGRLEICLQGKWGTVCRNSWGYQESSIACEQLGFQSENGSLLSGFKYGDGNRPILLSTLYCNREQNLLECRRANQYIGYHFCSSINGNAVALRCDASTCNHGDVRLYGGYVPWEGFPEVCINGKWTRTCRSSWDIADSNTFCRQLLNTSNNIRTATSRYGSLRNSPYARIVLSDIVCRSTPGSARFIRDCSYTASNASCSTFNVGCYLGANCSTGDVRLLTIPSSIKKVVEVCNDGVWGSITSSSWDNRDAQVVCRQLGQPWENSLATQAQRQSSLFYHRAYCTGNERNITNCHYSRTLSILSNSYSNNIFRYSSYSTAAAVVCKGNQTNHVAVCEQGAVRLLKSLESPAHVQGIVEICDNGQWAGICPGYWTSIHTKLTCQKILGKSPEAYWIKSYKETGISKFLLRRITCPSRASDISNCSVIYSRYDSCRTSSIIGVTCIDQTYDVSVSSLNTTEVYSIGETGQFHCNITPNPFSMDADVTLRYYWYLSETSRSIYSNSPNISVLFDSRYSKFNKILCEVTVSGRFTYRGYYLVEIEDALQVIKYEVIGDTINLEVNLTSGSYLNKYFSKLAWYYNKYAISSSTITSYAGGFNTSLNTMRYDEGEFRVRYEGLLAVPHNHVCEKDLLDVLQYYPTFRPAIFNRRKQDQIIFISSNLKMKSAKHIKFSNEDNINITIVLDLIGISNTYFTQYFLGIYNNRNIRLYYWTINSKYWTRTVSIANGLPTDAGLYGVILFSRYSSEFISNCSSYYNNFIRNSPFYLSTLVREKTHIHLQYYDNLTHSFSASKMNYYLSESTQLTCYGNVDIPQFVRISIEKYNLSLNASSSHEVQYSASDIHSSQQYGIYKCIITAEGTTFEQSILLKNKVDIMMEIIYDSMRKCQDNEGSIHKIVEILLHYFNRVCFCNITTSDFINSAIKCLDDSDTGKVQFSATLIYSNDMGDVTAASVIAQISFKVSLSSKGLNVGNNTVINSISYSHGSVQSAELKTTSNTIGTIVGAFFGGLILATLSFGIILALYCIWKKRSSSVNLHTPAAVKESKYESNLKTNSTIIPREYETAAQMKSNNMAALSVRSDREFEQPLYESVENIPMSDNIVYGDSVKPIKIQKKTI